MAFEWNSDKNERNIRKHGIHFADAVAALEDETAITIGDDSDPEEERFVSLGLDGLLRCLWLFTPVVGIMFESFQRVSPSHVNANRTRGNYERTIRLQQR